MRGLTEIVKLSRDASYGEYPWDMLLRDMTEWMGGSSAMFLHHAGSRGYNETISHSHDPVFVKMYNDHYSHLDPRAQASMKLAVGDTTTGQSITTNKRISHTMYYNDISLRADVKDSVHGVIADDLELGRRAISIQRGFKNDFFEAEQAAILKLAIPYLRQAMRDSLRLARVIAKEQSSEPFIYGLIDPGLQIQCFDNGKYSMKAVLDVDIDMVRQRLGVRNKQLARALPDAVRRASRGHSCTIRLEKSVLSLSRAPSALGWIGLKETAFFMVTEPKRHTGAKLFSTAFQFTAREAEILDFMLSHETRAEICDRLNISNETLRWHIKNMLSKTGHAKAHELVYDVSHNDLSNLE